MLRTRPVVETKLVALVIALMKLFESADALTFIPGYGDLTCSFIERAGQNGNITMEQCPLVTQFLTPCGCNVLSPAKPQNPNIAPTPVNIPSSHKHRIHDPKLRD
jgi:hypothetical protein